MNELTINELNIENMIYEIRGKQVMLDSDLARLYKCVNGTKTINQAVSRHKNRFPERFMFQLTKEEFFELRRNNLWSQNGTANISMTRSFPYVFTEQGVAMLATVLRTHVSEIVSIKIMDIFKDAKSELIIIDGYVDKTLLDMIKNLTCQVILITKRDNKTNNLATKKYNMQYHNLKIYYIDTFHDRYFIIDKKTIYHSGTSINHAGMRIFSINILLDEMVRKALINNIEEIITNKIYL